MFIVGPMACVVCYDIAKKHARANVLMIIIATAELYGGKCILAGSFTMSLSSILGLWYTDCSKQVL